jgi:hypothetical protein
MAEARRAKAAGL